MFELPEDTTVEQLADMVASFHFRLREKGVNKDTAQWLAQTYLEHLLRPQREAVSAPNWDDSGIPHWGGPLNGSN